MHSLLLSLMLLTLGSVSALGQPAPQSADAPIVLPPELARVLTDYEAYWKAGDAAALARLFTDDGFVLPPGQPLVRGRAAIQKLYTGPGAPVSLRAFAYAMHGKVGYIIGGFSPEPGTPDERQVHAHIAQG